MAREVNEKWGFGMAPPKEETQKSRLLACRAILQILSAEALPPNEEGVLEYLSTVKGLFSRVFKEDQWDWFTVTGQLGYPSGGLAYIIASQLYELRSSIRKQDKDAFKLARSYLLGLPSRLCLSAFLGEVSIKDEEGAGWIYVLSTRELQDLLKIGMTTRTVQQRVHEINGATGVAIPFGVRRCWRVSNPSLAEDSVHAVLASYRVRNDREFFRVDFKIASKLIRETIVNAGLEIRTLKAFAALKP